MQSNSQIKPNIPYQIKQLEQTKNETTNQHNEYTEFEEIPFIYTNEYLYHGIRYQIYLEKLENIFKTKKILAGKYLENYSPYIDNCNMGEYVSILKLTNNNHLEYETFIEDNISLLITPLINAIITKYLSYNIWLLIKEQNLKLNNLYSYMQGECLVKDYIDFKYIKAIGIPYQKLIQLEKQNYANKLIEDIIKLMEQYNVILPIVDTSRYNHIIINPKIKEHKLIKKLNIN